MTNAAALDEIRRSKGGVIGTNGKPVVAFRIDHGIDDWINTFWPLFRTRSIPASVGIVTDSIGNADDPYEPTTTTWATLLSESRKGFEVWAHSRTHRNPATTGNTIQDEVLGSLNELETQGFKVFGWHNPGIPDVSVADYSNNWEGDWNSGYGQLVLNNFGLVEMDGSVGGAMRALPTEGIVDAGHFTLDSYNQSQMEAIVDRAVRLGLSVEFMLHPKFIVAGTVTATTADITGLLDHVQSLWDAGTIEVLTASGLAFADPTTDRRLNLVGNGDFESVTTIPSGGQVAGVWGFAGGDGTGIAVNTDGGHGGSNYVHIPSTASFSYVYQGNTEIANLRAGGGTFMVEAWTRCTVSDTEARITVIDPSDSTALNYEVYETQTAGAGWQRMRFPFSIPTSTTNLQIRLGRRSGSGDIDFDDISIWPC